MCFLLLLLLASFRLPPSCLTPLPFPSLPVGWYFPHATASLDVAPVLPSPLDLQARSGCEYSPHTPVE